MDDTICVVHGVWKVKYASWVIQRGAPVAVALPEFPSAFVPYGVYRQAFKCAANAWRIRPGYSNRLISSTERTLSRDDVSQEDTSDSHCQQNGLLPLSLYLPIYSFSNTMLKWQLLVLII